MGRVYASVTGRRQVAVVDAKSLSVIARSPRPARTVASSMRVRLPTSHRAARRGTSTVRRAISAVRRKQSAARRPGRYLNPMWLRRYRSIGGVLASLMLAIVLAVQSGIVCPDRTHHHGDAMAMHHHTPRAPVEAAHIPLCCWALANCTSPAAPAARTSADAVALRTRDTPAFAVVTPRPLAFAPETPPPRV